jgi:CspA family cold shock protein
MNRSSSLTGTVIAFDRQVGLGEVQVADGAVYPFHCIEIADGTRDIAVGVSVQFDLIGKLGRYEAASVQPA